jgi:hypothetical protein
MAARPTAWKYGAHSESASHLDDGVNAVIDIWAVRDPDRTLWEIYLLQEDDGEHGRHERRCGRAPG